MKKFIFIYLILISVFTYSFSQEVKKTQNFTWLNYNSINPSNPSAVEFQEMTGWNDATGLPIYTFSIPLSDNISTDLINIEYEIKTSPFVHPLETEFLSKIQLPDNGIIKKYVVSIQKKYYLEIEILPVLFDDKTNAYLKIENINLNIQLQDITKTYSKLKVAEKTLSSSVLGQEKWVKVKIKKSGIHKIPYSSLKSWGFSEPSNVNIFGNGGNMLPRANSEPRIEDLAENAVLHYNNAIYFYAQGPVAWYYNHSKSMFFHELHDYIDEAYYFLSDANGSNKRVVLSNNISETYTNETDQFNSYAYHELENQNILNSGREWYGLRYDPGQERSYSFEFPNLVTSEPVILTTDVIGRSNTKSYYQISIGNNSTFNQTINISSVNYDNHIGSFALPGNNTTTFDHEYNTIDVTLQYNSTSNSALGWLNYLCLNAKEYIVLNKDQLSFRNADIIGDNSTTRFNLSGTKSTSVLWDITNHINPVEIKIENYGSNKGFTYNTNELKEFVVFNTDAALPQPEFEETVTNQDLRGLPVPEMLIVAHPLFEDEARRLADIHLNHSGLRCQVVFPQQIYNEFSSGSPDISAIRDYARYLYNQGDNFKYLLLFGDGSFDNRHYNDENTNFILTFQADNSINVAYSYTSDDFYGYLDDTEGSNMLTGKMDIGIGRLPVKSIEEAENVVNKIDNYLNSNNSGTWKTEITFLADDGDSNLHMTQADSLSREVYRKYQSFNHNKIYFDSYPKVITSAGDRYPEVNTKIKQSLENGTLLFNYTGHGNEKVLAHEHVLTSTEIQQLTNFNRLPVFVTATCEFSRYDDYHLTSAGEWVLLSPNGGGIGLFTTTRIAWSRENFLLNQKFYKYIFEKDENGNKLRMGDIIRNTKNNTTNSVNKLNFTLLGDPALQLAYPVDDVLTTAINGEPDPLKQDTLKALTVADIEGQVLNNNTEQNSINTVNIKVYDKPITVKTLGNRDAVPFEYQVYQNRIYQGEIDVENNHFLTSFVIPKDIRYNVGHGRISYYAYGDDGHEAFGANNSVLIGDVSDTPQNDPDGPQIELWLNDSTFQNGGITGTQPVLYARFLDESGINISGVGIGHDITLVIDDNRSLPINLNDYYIAEKNSFTEGKLQFQLPTLNIGTHSLSLKAWDNHNNSSESSLNFEVNLNGSMKLINTVVYPNPVEPGNTVKIYFEHDAPNMPLDIVCSVYSIEGRLIDRFEKNQPAIGTTITPIEWTPPALRRGIYILHCEVRSPENQTGKFSKKILVIK